MNDWRNIRDELPKEDFRLRVKTATAEYNTYLDLGNKGPSIPTYGFRDLATNETIKGVTHWKYER